MGYLHHARYFEFFELGRTELMRSAGHAYRDMEAAGHLLVVARAQCKFMKPAKYDDQLILTTRLQRVTTARIDHAYELTRDGAVLCTATTTLACVDRQGRLACVPDYLKTNSAV